MSPFRAMPHLLAALILSASLPAVEDEWCGADNVPTITLTLESAICRALNDNRQLLNSIDSAMGSRYQVEVALSEFDLKIEPTGDLGYVGGGPAGTGLGAGAGINFVKKLGCGTRISIFPSYNKANDMHITNVRSTITQPLLRGRGSEYAQSQLRAAQFAQRTSLRTLYLAQSKLILRTIQALYEVEKARESVVLNRESFNRVRLLYESAKYKVKIGLSEPLDIYRAEVEMRTTQDALEAAQERLLDTEDTLRDILAICPEVPIDVEVPTTPAFVRMCLDEAIAMALQNRMEVEQAEDQVLENERLARHAKENLWPQLDLVLNYNNCGQSAIFTDACWNDLVNTWGIGFKASKNINPTGDRIAYEQSLLTVNTGMRSADQTAANIAYEVKRALRQLERADERIAVQEELMHTAEGELRLAQIKFNRGLANNFDVIQAEKSLRSAQLTHWNAVIDHIVGEYQLRNVLGLLMERP